MIVMCASNVFFNGANRTVQNWSLRLVLVSPCFYVIRKAQSGPDCSILITSCFMKPPFKEFHKLISVLISQRGHKIIFKNHLLRAYGNDCKTKKKCMQCVIKLLNYISPLISLIPFLYICIYLFTILEMISCY